MPSNPKFFLNKVFPTNRRLLVNQSLKSIKIKKTWKKVLVIGVGNDPYRDLFDELDQYVRLDIFLDKNKFSVFFKKKYFLVIFLLSIFFLAFYFISL